MFARIVLISILTFLGLLLEIVCYNIFGGWFKPNFLIILVVYFNLAFGIRYSLFTAVLAGLWKDAVSVGALGDYTLAFVVCAFLTTLLKQYLFHFESGSMRTFMAFLMSVVFGLIVLGLNFLRVERDLGAVLLFGLIPEIVATILVAGFVLKQVRRCVLKFCV